MKYFQLLRVKHWVKNVLLFFPIIFSGLFTDSELLKMVIAGVFVFSCIASIIYILNDLMDMEKDKSHPEKCKRPLASGKVTKVEASVLLCMLFIFVIIMCLVFHFTYTFIGWLLIYFIINVGYNLGLKNVPLVDIIVLSVGYLIRLVCGGELAGTGISDWMFLTVMSAAFFLGFGKRRNELIRYGSKNRKSLELYTESFLDKGVQMFSILTVVFYALCCADKETAVAQRGINLLWTVPLVVLVLLRYNMILEDGKSDGDPVEVVQKDKVILLLILFYGISVVALIYISL